MNNKLDPSQQCVLEHWETINQMKDSCIQVERYLKESARKACDALHKSHTRLFEQTDKISEALL
jgi:hypothetical protein